MVAKASPSKSSLGSGGTVVTPTRRVLVVTDPLAIKSETQTPVTLAKRRDYAALQTVPQRLYFTKPLFREAGEGDGTPPKPTSTPRAAPPPARGGAGGDRASRRRPADEGGRAACARLLAAAADKAAETGDRRRAWAATCKRKDLSREFKHASRVAASRRVALDVDRALKDAAAADADVARTAALARRCDAAGAAAADRVAKTRRSDAARDAMRAIDARLDDSRSAAAGALFRLAMGCQRVDAQCEGLRRRAARELAHLEAEAKALRETVARMDRLPPATTREERVLAVCRRLNPDRRKLDPSRSPVDALLDVLARQAAAVDQRDARVDAAEADPPDPAAGFDARVAARASKKFGAWRRAPRPPPRKEGDDDDDALEEDIARHEGVLNAALAENRLIEAALTGLRERSKNLATLRGQPSPLAKCVANIFGVPDIDDVDAPDDFAYALVDAYKNPEPEAEPEPEREEYVPKKHDEVRLPARIRRATM